MNGDLIHYHSPRSQKARLAVTLHGWTIVWTLGCIAFVVTGFALLFLGWPLGWVALSAAFLCAMIEEWYRGELMALPIAKGGRIDDLLDGELLGRLTANPSPYDLSILLSQTNGGRFFMGRFGVGGGFLQQLVSTNPDDTEKVWQEALGIYRQLGLKSISAGVIVVALARQLPQENNLLAHLQLDDDALIAGVHWYEHLQDLIQSHKKAAKNPGGIGRDWSFGWIPTLSRYGQNISSGMNGTSIGLVELEAHTEALEQLLKGLGNQGSRSVALVGPTGVGKTEVVYALANRLMDPRADVPARARYHQVFLLDAAALISAAGGRGELEGLLTTVLNEAYAAKNIIVCLDNAQVFFEEGVGSINVTSVLLPILQASHLPIILTIDEQHYLKIAARSPDVANALNRIMVEPATEDETIAVMQDQLIMLEFKNKVTFMYQSLKEAYRLSERYIHDLEMPGRALRLLESSASFADQGLVTANSVQRAIEKTVGVKVGVANDDKERDTLLNLESLIHARMIGQTKAVAVVSDALRRARAGVRNQNRPIGTFLFLGPTGVGKTELAKSLAEVYFGDEDQLVRLDMNEYVLPQDVQRLIADGAQDQASLTAQVMKQPFSVVLLDEIEKAHDSVLTTLLQLLDEGILRDVNNREVSFRDTIVIATSNAASGRIREFVERGVVLESVQEQIVSELIDSDSFRPEFLNRFDEIVTFGPLSKPELMQVVDLMIAGINKTLSTQKISVAVSDDAKLYLVDAGYDPRLGARPMRRVVQKTVENIVAKAVLSNQLQPGGVMQIGIDEVRAVLDTKKAADDIIAAA